MLQASCWDTQYTEATCCPLSLGPEGNPTCWDGLHFTYQRCCPPKTLLSRTCVPQSSLVAAVAATVLVSAGLLLVRPSFCEEQEKQLNKGGNRLNHDYTVDNAKFLTSIFFVLVHICGGSPADKPASAVIAAIRFHLPLSCMISGALSSKVLTEDRRVRMVAFLVWPLVIFVLLLLPVLDLFGQVVLSSPGIRGHDFAATYADVWKALAMMDRWDTGWYLRALICWKLALPLTAVLPEIQQVLLALLVGILGAYSHHREWPIQITTLWPFFSFGQLFLQDFICWISCRSIPESLRLVFGWTLLTAWICSYVIFEPHIDSILRTVEPRRQEFAGFRDVIASKCEADVYLLWSKYVMCLFLRGIMALIFLILCVPRAKTWMSSFGTRSMYPYLLHQPLIFALNQRFGHLALPLSWANPWEPTRTPSLALRLHGCALAGIWFLIAALSSYLLSSKLCQNCFCWAMEPHWFLQLGRAKKD